MRQSALRLLLSALRFLFSTLCSLLLLSSCTPTPAPVSTPAPSTLALHVFRLNPPALLQLSVDLKSVERETPLSLPQDCALDGLYPSPQRARLVAEMLCANGPNALLLDPVTGTFTPLMAENVDSHFLSWAADGASVTLRVDSLGNPRIVQVDVSQLQITNYPITNYTYDLATSPDGTTAFTFSRGFGFGSETWLTTDNGRNTHLLISDPQNYLSFVRWSPDGTQAAFIKIPDSQIPFTVGEVWVVDADGSAPRKIAEADAGHGYAANWSPDGTRLAFVVRSNPDDPAADLAEGALVSNLVVADLVSGALTQVTHFEQGRVGTPVWSPDGNTLSFDYVLDGRMDVQIVDLASGKVSPLWTEPACCPIWLQR
ncbi:MAG: PD40 domain-containing protein [Chloroflexi bacterium]|nr:PD40 domain-containing protein [Chloroflexota bacterium]